MMCPRRRQRGWIAVYGRASAVRVFTMKVAVKSGHSPNLSFSLEKARVLSRKGSIDRIKSDDIIDYREGDEAVQAIKSAISPKARNYDMRTMLPASVIAHQISERTENRSDEFSDKQGERN
jgi:hypothetical protein